MLIQIFDNSNLFRPLEFELKRVQCISKGYFTYNCNLSRQDATEAAKLAGAMNKHYSSSEKLESPGSRVDFRSSNSGLHVSQVTGFMKFVNQTIYC